VDLDAAARRQHEAAMGAAASDLTDPAGPTPLVQIAPLSAPLVAPYPTAAAEAPNAAVDEPNSGNESPR
jgi:uncharacterized protein